jgi:regulator of sirC expression with transglutaminase-like and TPR domain
VGDIFRGAGDSGVPSVSEAEKRVSENPRDAQAFRDLATAHQAAGNTDDAIEALESFVALRPRNTDALRELAGLYLAKTNEAQERAQIAQFRSAYLAPATSVIGVVQFGGRPLDPDPITNAVSTRLEVDLRAALTEAQEASANAVGMYRRIAAATPDDPSVQLELAQAAEGAQDYATAVSAYETFLRLAPEDPTAPEVRRILRELRLRTGLTG